MKKLICALIALGCFWLSAAGVANMETVGFAKALLICINTLPIAFISLKIGGIIQ